MRAILSRRSTAAALLAAVILVMTPIGMRMSLSRAVDRVEAQFWTGVEPYGAIADYLSSAVDSALGLITVGAGYEAAEAEVRALRESRESLLSLLEAKSPSIAAIEACAGDMSADFEALRVSLMSRELSEKDVEDLEHYASAFEGAMGAASHSGYNEAVEDFTGKVYSSFPASILGVEPPEKFE